MAPWTARTVIRYQKSTEFGSCRERHRLCHDLEVEGHRCRTEGGTHGQQKGRLPSKHISTGPLPPRVEVSIALRADSRSISGAPFRLALRLRSARATLRGPRGDPCCGPDMGYDPLRQQYALPPGLVQTIDRHGDRRSTGPGTPMGTLCIGVDAWLDSAVGGVEMRRSERGEGQLSWPSGPLKLFVELFKVASELPSASAGGLPKPCKEPVNRWSSKAKLPLFCCSSCERGESDEEADRRPCLVILFRGFSSSSHPRCMGKINNSTIGRVLSSANCRLAFSFISGSQQRSAK